jgi:hypothetical protein
MRHTRALAFGLMLLAGIPACTNPFNPRVAPTIGISQPPPEATSPIGVLRRYEWCWNHRDADVYRDLFTDDYRFQFALTDTAGNAYRGNVLTREEELTIAENIFVRGTATERPPSRIDLTFDQNLIATPDSRPGKDAIVHKEIRAQTLLRITDPDIEVIGFTRFFVVRGDSALLPQELKDRGFTQDPGRWYIERIEDETLQPETAPSRIPAAGARAAWGAVAEAPRAAGGRSADAADAQSNPLSVSWGWVRAFYDRSIRR